MNQSTNQSTVATRILGILIVVSMVWLLAVIGDKTREYTRQPKIAEPDPKGRGFRQEVFQTVVEPVEVEDYGNGVRYFPCSASYPCTGGGLSKRLSKFMGDHPNLELVSFTGVNPDSYGAQGYIAVFRNR